ncbi:MAG: tRNA lysidine(34) synthetase TilS [Thermoleophilia bacterium]
MTAASVTGSDYRLVQRVCAFVRERELLRRGERPLLLLSGGADSMALHWLLGEVDARLELGLQAGVLHVDYATRGADSTRDRRIVEEACLRSRMPVHVVRLPRKLSGGNFQERARSLRYDAARRLCGERGYDVIVTAHNRDDQAETVLYRLAKYATPRGLAGMRARQGDLARPLLCLGGDEIRDLCRRRGIAYGEDITNCEPRYARNLIRLEVLPLLRRINPLVAETLCAAAELAAADADILASAASAGLSRVTRSCGSDEIAALDVEALRLESRSMRALILHELVRNAAGNEALVERRSIEGLIDLLERRDDAGRALLVCDLEAVRGGGLLRLRRRRAPHCCPDVSVRVVRKADTSVRFCERKWRSRLDVGAHLPTHATQAAVGLAEPPQAVVIRHPRRGERFRPLGLAAETTVARFLAGARVLADERARAVVLDVDGVAVWVGFVGRDGVFRGRVAHEYRVHESSRWTLCLCEEVV